jgi:hypothetical protein
MAYYEHELAVMAGLSPCGTGALATLSQLPRNHLKTPRCSRLGCFLLPMSTSLAINDIHTLKIIYSYGST